MIAVRRALWEELVAGPPETRQRRADPEDLLPRFELIPRGRWRSALEDVKALKRFLRQRVGRSWDAVEAELPTLVERRHVALELVRERARSLVALHPVTIDGCLRYDTGGGSYAKLRDSNAKKLFVAPDTGLLQAVTPET